MNLGAIKMKKRLLLLFFSIYLILLSTVTTFADSIQLEATPIYKNTSIIVDGEIIDAANYEIYIDENGRVMYPLRLISESLGDEITWESSKKSALLKNYNGQIWVNPGTNVVTVNGVDKKLPYNIELQTSRIYVPSEFISEILGARFEVDEDTKEISLHKQSLNLEDTQLST